MTHVHRDGALPPIPSRVIARDAFPWVQAKVLAKETVCVLDTDEAPADAARDMESWREFGIRSTFCIPLSVGRGPVTGFLSFDAILQPRDWPESLREELQLVAQIFANAIDRKRAEQKLRDSEARMTLAAASAGAGLWTLEPNGGHMWATEKTYELFGLNPCGEINLDVVLAIIDPDDRDKVREAIQEAMQSGQEITMEYRVHCPDGVRWISSRGRRHRGSDLEPDKLMGASIDITESKRIELELAKLREHLQAESDYLKEEIQVNGRFEDIVGQSKELRKVFERIEQVAPTDSTVLITGETGTGKELIARAIHRLSKRKNRVMVKVDCSALPAGLIESELFGREKGAYTGALTKETGRFELASGSTIFLDEIGELPLELQAKLLRVLQDGQFEHLGSSKTQNVDVRVIAATNRDLEEKVADGSFRQDLYFRLNVFPIHVPPLRERADDIPQLTWTFVREFARKMGKTIDAIPRKTMERLQRYPWPGNVRELRNAVEQAVIVTSGQQLDIQTAEPRTAPSMSTLKGAEKQQIMAVLQRTGWRIKGPGGAAELLGVKPSTLYSMMKRLHIPTKEQQDAMSS